MAKTKFKPAAGVMGGSVTHLLHRALQTALDYHAEAAGPGAITQRQFTVLAAAAAHEGLTQNDLVRATGIDRSTLADLVARMLVKGLLVRERSATDGRAKSVRLSEQGRAALAAGAAPAHTADARLLARLSPKKRDSLIKGLSAITAEAPAKFKNKKSTPDGSAKVKTGKKHRKVKKAKLALAV